ncbi:hypothetical protein J1C81_07380 [Streptococcus sanguinis]|jgi:hypothetical protein|uniref:Lipoprotein n=3 Tax=Streptococcus sanguinis TaxID=1305 RepID=F0IU58_STRSA|nr:MULTISPECIES: hypothetical protein [Streptococcus]PLA64617.1 hypothetical protein CYK23_01345 [Streptococcus salivarius]RKW00921.1 MAG: hypothetical protein D8H99_16820 [Streptococcus sp.]EGD38680.1 hypothetical protein HMPREF9384_1370 [Streptococcus sanguinis SK160]EGF15080.1 hypothetical protein HMPREF9386_0924 [Streptococcus sanguinis SK330]MDN5010808.1 hypothetical protein [Streptococcus sp. SN3]
MKKQNWLLGIVIAGLLLFFVVSLHGCDFGCETIPKNRTREQYDFEGTFEPMFKFLEQEKKDFTEIETYSPSLTIIDSNGEMTTYDIFLKLQAGSGKGTYTISKGKYKKDAQEVGVTYTDGKLQYEGELEPLFDEEIFNLLIDRNYFEALEVKETFKSAETELSDIIYKAENQSVLYKKIVEKYNLPSDTKLSVSLSHAYYNRYDVLLNFESKQKVIQISTAIYLVKRK